MRSGELAMLAGVSTDTLRHYEGLGVLARPRRTAAGYRLYPADAVQRVQLVRRALAASKLEQIDRRLEELLLLRKNLAELLATWDDRLEHTPQGERAGLLEMLPGSIRPPSRKGIKR
ncbi:Transcriptional regulator, MerR family [Candidatus Sulfopaludibacter sp. SbA3]|nr:Transcriptional regulator, MerR family [Candidatus Sulfopaludibacter sp. SbA3]